MHQTSYQIDEGIPNQQITHANFAKKKKTLRIFVEKTIVCKIIQICVLEKIFK